MPNAELSSPREGIVNDLTRAGVNEFRISIK